MPDIAVFTPTLGIFAVLWALGIYAVVLVAWLGAFLLRYARAP